MRRSVQEGGIIELDWQETLSEATAGEALRGLALTPASTFCVGEQSCLTVILAAGVSGQVPEAERLQPCMVH